jgi:UDPglucose 6-dehydrogenase
MHLVVIGAGYVGLVTGACLSEFGHVVVCVDRDAARIAALEQGKTPVFEPGLDAILQRNTRAGRLRFTTDLAAAMPGAELAMIAVGTPTRPEDRSVDLSAVHAAAREVAQSAPDGPLVVIKSTVPVGTCHGVVKILRAARPDAAWDVASNPEFLREGSAVEDFLRPDRIVCGVTSPRAERLLAELYRPLYLNQTPLLVTTPESAELVKYATNAFLATKVAFINEMADLCEATGADVQAVAKGLGMDRRIGPKFLHAGPGFGGSCLPKDGRALCAMGRAREAQLKIVEAVMAANDERKRRMPDRIAAALGGDLQGKTLAVLGVTFKPNTDDVREAPSLEIIPLLQKSGARIRAYDPKGMPKAAEILAGVAWCEDAYAAMQGADALVILTEWNEFRALHLDRVKALLRQPVVIDLRDIYAPQQMAELGFRYTSVGRPYPPRPGATARHAR